VAAKKGKHFMQSKLLIVVTSLLLSAFTVDPLVAQATPSPETPQVQPAVPTDTSATDTAASDTAATDAPQTDTAPLNSAQIVASAVPKTVTIREGTEVQLEFAEDVSSKTATEDDKVNFRLAEDLKVGDVVVARTGSIAVGTVTNAKKAGMMGRGGELNVRLEYLKIGDSRVRLRANKGKEGANKVGATVALTVLFGPIGLLKRGHNIDIKEGTSLAAWVDQDSVVTVEETPK
jgi:hypothetical protein